MRKMNVMVKKVNTIVMSVILMVLCVINLGTNLYTHAMDGVPEDTSAMVNEMADKINEARAELGLQPLTLIPYLNEVSEIRASEQPIKYSHTRPDGSDWITLVDSDIAHWGRAFEILARGSANVNLIFNAWKASEGHWRAIINPEANCIGIGIAYDPESPKKWHWASIILYIPDEENIKELTGEMVLTDEENAAPAEDAAPAELEYVSGDINGDGMIDSFDLVVLKQYVSGAIGFNEVQLAAADVFADGTVDAQDVKALISFILGEYNSLPVVA